MSAVAFDTLRDVQLCGIYHKSPGSASCEALRQQVIAMRRDNNLPPTLELGDENKPPMFFLHGWPDTAAVWANQFEHFCMGDDAPFYCVAPSWIVYKTQLP